MGHPDFLIRPMKYTNIVILTGAGISEESGIQTFRGAEGLWENHRIEEVAHPSAFQKNPELVHRFYNERRKKLQSKEIAPNPAHVALKELEEHSFAHFLLVTQNIDNLHERAGAEKVVHMHGEIMKARCLSCGVSNEHTEDLGLSSVCKSCGVKGKLRPDIVWFEEAVMHMKEISDHLRLCDLFICIGTSGQVYPAAGFVDMVPLDCRKVEINLVPTQISALFNEHYYGKASIEVPQFVKSLLNEQDD